MLIYFSCPSFFVSIHFFFLIVIMCTLIFGALFFVFVCFFLYLKICFLKKRKKKKTLKVNSYCLYKSIQTKKNLIHRDIKYVNCTQKQ